MMAKFKVTASKISFFNGIVEAKDITNLDAMNVEEMGLADYYSKAMKVICIEEEPEDEDPIQAYLKRMAERGDDEAKSLLK
jgi:hypothetical protein